MIIKYTFLSVQSDNPHTNMSSLSSFIYVLTLKMLITTARDDMFLQLDFCQTIHMKCQVSFSLKNNKKTDYDLKILLSALSFKNTVHQNDPNHVYILFLRPFSKQ